jgi:hypothetical protein
MHIFVYIYVYTCINVCKKNAQTICTYVFINVSVWGCICAYTMYIAIAMQLYIHICIRKFVHIHECIPVHQYTFIRMYIHMCVNIYI